jgi:excisionase family DNA binding protein
VLTVREAAHVVKLTQWAIYRAIQRGDLVAYKPGGRLRINEKDLRAWLEATRVRPASTAPAAPARPDPPPELIGPSRQRASEDTLRARVRERRRRQSAA